MDWITTSRKYRSRVGAIATTLLVVPALGHGSARAADPPTGASGGKAVTVQVVQPVERALTRVLNIPATLLPGEAADLYAKISGYIAAIDVDIGSRVRQGDTLLTVDVPEMADELRQAEAILTAKETKVQALQAKAVQARRMVEIARAEVDRAVARHDLEEISLKRQQELREGNAISQQTLDEAQSARAVTDAQLRIANARVAGAQADAAAVDAEVAVVQSEAAVAGAELARLRTLMSYAVIKAPFNGVITARLVDPGAFVRSAADGTTTSLLTIANVSYIRLVLQIPESDVSYVRIGTPVDIDVKALRGDLIAATVTRTAMALKADTRTMRVEVDLDNNEGLLMPGMYAKVAVKLEFKAQAMVVPSRAIHVAGREVSVWVANESAVKVKPVKVGYDDGIWAEVLEGLTGAEKVIISAGGALAPGAPVTPVSVDPS